MNNILREDEKKQREKTVKQWTVKYGAKIFKKAGQKPKRRPYAKEMHFYDEGKEREGIRIDVTHLQPFVRSDIETKYTHFFPRMNYNLGGAYPWFIKMVTTEKRAADQCAKRLKKKHFVRVVKDKVKGRNFYAVYYNHHKQAGTDAVERAARADRRRLQRDLNQAQRKKLKELGRKTIVRTIHDYKDYQYVFDIFRNKPPIRIEFLMKYPVDASSEEELVEWLEANFYLKLDTDTGDLYVKRRFSDHWKLESLWCGKIIGYEDKMDFLYDRWLRVYFEPWKYLQTTDGRENNVVFSSSTTGNGWIALLKRMMEIYRFDV
jgi:hypothetical protein